MSYSAGEVIVSRSLLLSNRTLLIVYHPTDKAAQADAQFTQLGINLGELESLTEQERECGKGFRGVQATQRAVVTRGATRSGLPEGFALECPRSVSHRLVVARQQVLQLSTTL